MSQVASQAVRPRREITSIYPIISLLMIAIIALGFWPSYFGLLIGKGVEKELFIHVHAIVYVSWMALFVTQSSFIALDRRALHRKLGQFVMFYGFVVLAVGVVTAVLRFWTMNADGLAEPARQFVIWPLLDMVIFAGFFIPAIVYRRQPEIHKRLMIVATTNLIVAAAFRAVGLATPVTHLIFVLLWLSPIFVAVVHDFVRSRTVHPVYVTGIAVLTISSFRDVVTSTDAWFAFTQWMASLAA